MHTINNLSLIFGVVLLSAGFSAQAQTESCAQILRKAQRNYEMGVLNGIPELLDGCLKKGFTKNEAVEAYKLLALVHLFNDDLNLANQDMLNLLKTDPLFEPKNSDPIELQTLYSNFRTDPVFSLGVLGGVNLAHTVIINEFGVYSLDDAEPVIKPLLGFQIVGKFNRYLADRLELNLEFEFQQKKYEYRNLQFGYADIYFAESQVKIGLPAALSYDFVFNNYRPYIKVGLKPSLLLASNISPIRSYADNSNPDVTGQQIDMTPFRRRLNLAPVVGVGLRYKAKQGYFILDFRYNQQLFLDNISKTRYDNQELFYKYFYLDNDFLFNKIDFMIGYVHAFYKPQLKPQ